MKNYNIAVIPGDGIGPEVISVAVEILEILEKKFSFKLNKKYFPHSGLHYLKTGEVLNDESLKSIKKNQAILLGAIGHPEVKPGIIEKGLLLKLRFDFDQYINLRPIKLFQGVENVLKTHKEIDILCIRENVGGLYSGAGGATMQGTNNETAIQTMIYTYKQVERTLQYAFESAKNRPKKSLSLIGKSNVLTHIFSLWLRVFEKLSLEYPQVKTHYYHIDAACMFMIKTPEIFDVIVTTNMFGDIITDIGAEIQGGMGIAASGNLNPSFEYPSMFEPVHGSAPDIAGQGKANPIATLLSSQMLLSFLGESKAAQNLENAIKKFLKSNNPSYLNTKEISALIKKSL